MSCVNPDIGNMIAQYEFGRLTKEKTAEFEAHLLACASCFQNLYEFSPVVARLREKPGDFLAVVDKKESVLSAFGLKLVELLGQIPVYARFAVPAVVTLAVGVLFYVQPVSELQDLTQIEAFPYYPMKIKQGGFDNLAKQLFDEGMIDYVNKNYPAAREKIKAAVEEAPENFNYRFYLGLCYLLTGQVETAIKHLQKVIESGGADAYHEEAHWYLGNAWLLKENRAQALAAFQKTVSFEGDFEWRAQEIIDKLNH